MLTLNQKISKLRTDLLSLTMFQSTSDNDGIIEIAMNALIQIDASVNQIIIDNSNNRITSTRDISLNHLQANQLTISGTEGPSFVVDSVGHINVYKDIDVLGNLVVKDIDIHRRLGEIDQSFGTLGEYVVSVDTSINLLEQKVDTLQGVVDVSFESVATSIGSLDTSLNLLEQKVDTSLNTLQGIVDASFTTVSSRIGFLDTSLNLLEERVDTSLNTLQGIVGVSFETVSTRIGLLDTSLNLLEQKVDTSLNTLQGVVGVSFESVSSRIGLLDTSLNLLEQKVDTSLNTLQGVVGVSFESVSSRIGFLDTSLNLLEQKVDTSLNTLQGRVDVSFESVATSIGLLDTSLNLLEQKVDTSLNTLQGIVGVSFESVSTRIVFLDTSLNLLEERVDTSLNTLQGLVDASFTTVYSRIGLLDTSLNLLEERVDTSLNTLQGLVDASFTKVSTRIGLLDTSLNLLEQKVDTSLNTLQGIVDASFTTVSTRIGFLDTSLNLLEQKVDTSLNTLQGVVGVSFESVSSRIGFLDTSLNTLKGVVDASFERTDTSLTELFLIKQDKIENKDVVFNRVDVTKDLHVGGRLTVDGSFNVANLIYTTVQNEVVLSTQLDISNQGYGPALRVTQYGNGDENHVALFNAGTEGDAMLIDSVGDITVYKQMNVFELVVKETNITDQIHIIDQSFQKIDLSINEIYELLDETDTGIFTTTDNINYFTNKNVFIENFNEGVKFSVNGGVRIYDSGSTATEIYLPNDWIQDMSKNIYFEQGNVGIGTMTNSDNSFVLDVMGGVRIRNNGPFNSDLYIQNDWVHDMSNNIYFEQGNIGIGKKHSDAYILDVNGGVRISNQTDETLNIFDISGGWLNGNGFITYSGRVNIGNVVDDETVRLNVDGKIVASVVETSSDIRLKTNIEDICGALDIIRQLHPKKYNKPSEKIKEFGFIANEVLELSDISFVVSKTGEYYTLNYTSLFTLAVQGIKDLDHELRAKNAELEERIAYLENLILHK